MIALWDSQILLIEAKCNKNIHEIHDYSNLIDSVAYAKEQLKLRIKTLTEDWDSVRGEIDFLQDIKTCPPINALVLVNSPAFHQDFSDGIAVMDWNAMIRFFQDNTFNYSILDSTEPIESIKFRSDGKFILSEFKRYINLLPQKMMFTPNITKNRHLIVEGFAGTYNVYRNSYRLVFNGLLNGFKNLSEVHYVDED